jgi:hypothetical protein
VGLRAIIGQAIETAFTAAGDIPKLMTVRHYSGVPVRDPVTGEYSQVETSFPAPVILSEIGAQETRANSLGATRKAIIKVSDVPVLNVGDLLFDNTEVFEVLINDQDPTQQIHMPYLRLAKVTRSSLGPVYLTTETGEMLETETGEPLEI